MLFIKQKGEDFGHGVNRQERYQGFDKQANKFKIIVELEVRFKSRAFRKSIQENMMVYSIGEVARMMDVPASTLRYYDREGLLPSVKRSSGGIRVFTDLEIEILKVIECLKTTGMQIKDIKQFLDWCQEGDNTLQKRRDMFYERKAIVEKQMEELQKTMEMIQFKCWYYDTALEAGTENVPRNMSIDELPDVAQKGMAKLQRKFAE